MHIDLASKFDAVNKLDGECHVDLSMKSGNKMSATVNYKSTGPTWVEYDFQSEVFICSNFENTFIKRRKINKSCV